MDQESVLNILLPILTSIITGGFILVFVEIGNRMNRENDRYDQIMRPFIHKLSAYFRFIDWCRGGILYPKELNEYETNFKHLIEGISTYGGKLINSGGDFAIDNFSSKELQVICENQISNIWYYYNKMHPCNLIWEDNEVTKAFIIKELKEIFPNYLSHPLNVNLVSNVSGDFYTDIYLPIETEIYKHERYIHLYKLPTIIVVISVAFVLVVLSSMLFTYLPIWIMQTAGVITIILLALCVMLLGIETKIQIEYCIRFSDYISTKSRKIKRLFRKHKN